jgi:hypothetical protein
MNAIFQKAAKKCNKKKISPCLEHGNFGGILKNRIFVGTNSFMPFEM